MTFYLFYRPNGAALTSVELRKDAAVRFLPPSTNPQHQRCCHPFTRPDLLLARRNSLAHLPRRRQASRSGFALNGARRQRRLPSQVESRSRCLSQTRRVEPFLRRRPGRPNPFHTPDGNDGCGADSGPSEGGTLRFAVRPIEASKTGLLRPLYAESSHSVGWRRTSAQGRWLAFGERQDWADSAPTGAASGRTGVRAIAGLGQS
jgi:hypothetical protein